MNARQQLEKLSHGWYGYAVFCALFSVFGLRAAGIVSLAIGLSIWAVINAFFLVLTLALMTYFSRRLLARSARMRVFLLVASVLGAVVSISTFAREANLLAHLWSFSLMLQMAMTAVSGFMHARSFVVLNDSRVRAHFQGR